MKMPRRRIRPRRRLTSLDGYALLLALVGALAGCSASLGGSSSGGTNYSLGLAGSTADHPSQPPNIADGGPGGTYAFVYDNQIWLHQAGQAGAKQLTHLVLSNGATLSWGPLAWSPGGRYIAFALAQNLTPSVPGRSAAPLLYVDTTSGDTFGTSGTGSIYGHTYAWFDDRALFYSGGGGIQMYDAGDKDPRVWQVVSPFQDALRAGGTDYYSSAGTALGDMTIAGGNLFFTQMNLGSIGGAGVVGDAHVEEYSLSAFGGYEAIAPDDSMLPDWLADPRHLPLSAYSADLGSAANLGAVYSDASGNLVAGAWQVSRRGSVLVSQHVDGVDTKAGTTSSHYSGCTQFAYSGCPAILGVAGTAPISVHPSLAISPDGSSVALTTDALYTQQLAGGSVAKTAGAGSTCPPAWSPDSKHVAVTQVVSQTTDASGVLRSVTNILSATGSSSAAFIGGAQNLAWFYSS
jgi:hypothetical protein